MVDSHPNLRMRKHQEEGQHHDRSMEEEIEITPLISHRRQEELNNDSDVSSASDGFLLVPLRERSIVMRLDVWPFLISYTLLISLDYYYGSDEAHDMPTSLHFFSEICFNLESTSRITAFCLFSMINFQLVYCFSNFSSTIELYR